MYPSTRQDDEYDDAYESDLAGGSNNPFESPTKTRQALSQVKQVKCQDQGMTVALRKSQVRVRIDTDELPCIT